MTVDWAELSNIRSGAQWTLANAVKHLSARAEDPWADYWKAKQTLTGAIRTLSNAR